MQHTATTGGQSAAMPPPPSESSSSSANVDEFEAILNQLTALGTEIDQELSASKRTSSSEQCTSSMTTPNGTGPNVNSGTKMKTIGEEGGAPATAGFYGHPGAVVHHHFSHYHSQSLENDHHHHHSPLVSTTTLRTDSPDNDSAFSDSISLLSTEQSSSSSSSSSSSGPQSASTKSTNSSLTNVNGSPSVGVAPLAPSGATVSSTSSVLGPPPNSPHSTTTSHSDSSTLVAGGSSSTLSSLDHQLMQLNQQQELFFEQLGRSVGDHSMALPMSPSKCNGSNLNFDKEKDDGLYLKVFAQDNSAKSLLADERMTIGAICGQLAAKNHISLDTSLCIIEHMPTLYLERFFEDHESLVENVLHWGRDTANKLYFMQRADKYDLFVHPEKYLISGEPSSGESTLKSGGAAADHLRHDLIQQFFSPTSGVIKVPEIDGELYLRADGKKTWKKYFFTLRSSGLYYCTKGKPKSTKDLVCLATFDLNCVYLGFGWKKKFKAPNDYGFAIKHPQVQAKAPKHIKYLCAETEESLRLWLTGMRIAKYGRQLWLNYEQFQMATRVEEGTGSNGEAKSNHPKTSVSFTDSPDYHGHPASVVMRSNRISRDESVRSSSTSSTSSGCMSEGHASTGSGHTSVSNPGSGHVHHHHHHHHNGANHGFPGSPMNGAGGHGLESTTSHASVTSLHYLGSPTHHYSHFSPTSTISLNTPPTSAFDTDYPLGTIKRKPSVPILPKIPLTKNTRNLALQSEDVLLEQNEHDANGNGGANYDPNEEIYGHSPNGATSGSEFQRGTFKTGTLRRSTTDERMKGTASKMNISSPMHHLHQLSSPSYLPVPQTQTTSKSDSEDDLPPPPPPLKESESTLSLSASFPPPPPEVLSAPSPPAPVVTSSPYGSMTPQPQPKNAQHSSRLSRRLSDLSSNSTHYLNYRNGGQQSDRSPEIESQYPQHQQQQPNQNFLMSANSRASIATSSGYDPNSGGLYGPAGFVTLKAYHSRGNSLSGNGSMSQSRQHRQLTLDLNSALSKYATTPRIRNEAFIASLAAAATAAASTQPNEYPNGANCEHPPYPGATLPANPGITTSNNNYSPGAHYHAGHNEPVAPVNGCTYGSSNGLLPPPPPPPSDLTGGSSSGAGEINEINHNHCHGPPSFGYGQPQQQQHPQMMNGGYPNNSASSYPTGSLAILPPPPPVPTSPGLITSGVTISRPATSNNENVIYMSISPHLLQKHQAMAQVNSQQSQSQPQPIYGIPPEQVFLKNMERVMQKKWHVAQMLSREEQGDATPGQVLGFRDPAYLPPRSESYGQQGGMMTQQNGYPQQQQPHYHVHHYSGPGPMYQPYGNQNSQQNVRNSGKSVRIADNPTVFGPGSPVNANLGPTSPPVCQSPVHLQYSPGLGPQQGPQQQQIYGFGGKRIPPPPPKRSDSTHLTTNGGSSSRR